MPDERRSFWRLPLAREIAAIVVLKVAVLLVIKSIWFDAPTVPHDGIQRTSQHLFNTAPSSALAEEKPR
ncbi:hypothetical protein CK486_03435 [Pseudomonas sp. HAR-UPW-AIA-41]|uniref:cytochrome oxidase putative small subunit CydP n=1 Tax=Pseudomonas sp. HAR-UPW-AIA-41 TaxID=1985301 RepID=UPI000BB36C50|nr:cytochrome oxidase putative small subunit CydP [Pseudomonas sp. HAR-UPW-AIA-41]PAV49832.1 hypothetical protein CK486_03435 [Pseudomonas sp. HAR-UPW-AIA-41]